MVSYLERKYPNGDHINELVEEIDKTYCHSDGAKTKDDILDT